MWQKPDQTDPAGRSAPPYGADGGGGYDDQPSTEGRQAAPAWQQPTAPYGAYPADSAYAQYAPHPTQHPYANGQQWGQPQQQWGTAQQWGQPPYGYGQQNRGANGLAIASLVLGILWLFWIGSVLALIFGYIARSQMKSSRQSGDGMAIAGIVLGWLRVAIFLLNIIAIVSGIS